MPAPRSNTGSHGLWFRKSGASPPILTRKAASGAWRENGGNRDARECAPGPHLRVIDPNSIFRGALTMGSNLSAEIRDIGFTVVDGVIPSEAAATIRDRILEVHESEAEENRLREEQIRAQGH